MKQLINILDIPFINTSIDEMVNTLSKRIDREEKTFVVTANPEIVMHTLENEKYKQYVKSADYVVPDGNGILLAAKMLKTPIKERIAGFDLMMKLLHEANAKQWKVFLLGGKEEVNHKAVEVLKNDFPKMQLVGSQHGYFRWEDPSLRDKIAELKPDLVFVALGFPRQEKWIAENLPFYHKGVFIGVGGSIDVIAGVVKRAPAIWQKMKLEWFYRLLKQPSRWRRVLALPKFVIEVLHKKRI